MRFAFGLLAALALASPAHAEIHPARKAAAAVTAVVPGIVVPGLGHFVAGEPATGRRLLATGWIGIGTTLGGVAGIALTGASPRTIGPLALVTVAGAGTMFGAVLADLYGVLAPAGGLGRAAAPPPLSLELGYRHVYDPTASYRHFAVAAAEARRGRLALAPSVWAALHEDNLRARLAGSLRLVRGGGSFLDLETAIVFHRFGEEGFSTLLGELSLGGRVELGALDARLSGAFAELSGGVALGGVRYHGVATDYTDLLLGRAAFGIHLGGRGELALEYDHRHDGFAAGLKMPGLGSGPAGHFGARAHWVAPSGWGARAEVQLGSAIVSGVSVIWRP